MKILFLQVLLFMFFNLLLTCLALRHHRFEVRDVSYTKLCSTKNILTVNGQFPGPTLYVTKGETIIVHLYNRANYNITIHWHGVDQPRYPWSDGPEYVTQCPIRPGGKFSQKVIFSEEEGTLWWHAHSDWSRATVHGAIVVKPKLGTTYPFPNPHKEVPIILGEWWKKDVVEVLLSQNYKYYNSRHHGAKVVSRQNGFGEAGNSAHDVPQRQVSKSHNSTHSEDEEISIILMEEAVTE